MSALVTGHHGDIGSVVAPMLNVAGHAVTGLDTFVYERCDLLDYGLDFATPRLDLREVTTDALEGFDGIVHLAALPNDPPGELDEELTREINFRGTVELARRVLHCRVSALAGWDRSCVPEAVAYKLHPRCPFIIARTGGAWT